MKKDPFYSKLSSLVFPIMLQAFMLALVSATDAIMLGLVDQVSMASVSLSGQVQFILSMFVLGIAAGAAILIAQYWGKGDLPTIERIIPIALRYNLIFGGAFTLATLAAPMAVISFFTNDAQLRAAGALYLRAVSLSYFLCAVAQIYLMVLKNTGLAKLSSLISSSAVALNIVLNALLIFGLFGFPRLGVAGAAYATVIARGVELLCAWLTAGRKCPVRVRWSMIFNRERVLEADFRKYTVPTLAAALVWGCAYTLYSVIMGHIDQDAVAAFSITAIAKALVSCLIRGVAGGAGIIIGNTLGAGELELAKDYGKRLAILSFIVGGLTGGFLALISPLIVKYAPLSTSAGEYLQGMLLFCGLNIVFQSFNTTTLDGIFTAGGDAKFDMYGNIVVMWCITVPLGFIMAFVFKLPAVAIYCIVNCDEIVKVPAVIHHYKKYIWLRNLTREM